MKIILLLSALLISNSIFAQSEKISDSLLMKINEQNTIYVKAVFNKIDTLALNFDTGMTELILTNYTLKNKIKTSVELYDKFYDLQIGKNTYSTKVYDAELTGHGTEGRFGWDLFKDKVVELNYDKDLMVVHSKLPKNIEGNKKFSKLKMEFYKEYCFLVSSEIKQGKASEKDLFLFDTGYQRTAMLDNDLLAEKKFPVQNMKIIKKVIMRGGQGNEIPVITSNLEMLTIGKFKLKNVPVQQTTTSKPVKGKNIHILGNEVLKRFNIFLDFQNKVVYLRPNHLFKDTYIDRK
ncbi:clan AA aspartic protease [Flavobacterium sp. AC]|uniref:Clan AA aspartic protease n=1 Tax=Flavobacterium azizsancarii TaxID=2961580 RepID=A0ABT4WEY0_9FLAO|nr:clan AA aspartic protease [Flavobacterium azizsancarii]MDA6071098.1 clan AA aspartic protease [Flavobacterium azizsancarii]